MKTIQTKNKGQFLIAEWNHYKKFYKDFQEYLFNLQDLIRYCKKCKTYYWFECQKRCKCKGK